MRSGTRRGEGKMAPKQDARAARPWVRPVISVCSRSMLVALGSMGRGAHAGGNLFSRRGDSRNTMTYMAYIPSQRQPRGMTSRPVASYASPPSRASSGHHRVPGQTATTPAMANVGAGKERAMLLKADTSLPSIGQLYSIQRLSQPAKRMRILDQLVGE